MFDIFSKNYRNSKYWRIIYCHFLKQLAEVCFVGYSIALFWIGMCRSWLKSIFGWVRDCNCTLTDLDFCSSHQPCQHGATCHNNDQDSYSCVCVDGFSGTNCERDLRDCRHHLLSCLHNGTCQVFDRHLTPARRCEMEITQQTDLEFSQNKTGLRGYDAIRHRDDFAG